MGISKLSYGSGDNLFEISYKDDEVITETGGTSYMSDNFEANTFAAYQNRSQTQFFETGTDSSYNNANEDNCMWRKWDGWNKTDLLPGADNADGYYTFNSLLTDYNGRRIITELTDIQRVIWRPEVAEETVNTRINGTAVTVTTYRINTNTNQPYCDIIDATNPVHYTAQNVPIYPWLLYPQDKKQLQLHYLREDSLSPWGSSCTRNSGVRNGVNNRARTYPLSTALVNYDVPIGNNQTFGFYSDDNNYLFACSLSTNNFANGTVYCYIVTEDELKKWLASAGLKFVYKNRLYKPVVENGVIVGYTDDMLSKSEWDDWHTKDDHEKPVTPPAPVPSGGDDMDIMATGATGSSGGFTHFYIMSPQDLIDLLSDFYTRADPGETLSNNLVCSYILGIPSSAFCATESVPVAIHNSAQGTPFVSQANYSHVTATNNLLIVGNFDVPRMTNTFYDFSPYSTYEVFIPCCGWVALPDTVAGRKIYVEMYIDIASCCVKAGVKISGEGVCAVANGVLGASIPMAVIESGILRGNNIQAGLGIIGGGINTGIGAGNGNALGIGFGVQQILGGLIDCTVAGNTNYTQQKGGTGDITQFAMGHECYLKVTHPELDPVVNESIFGHSVGYLCNSIGKLETFSGFTVCGNPHVTFSASAEEREEIERLLSMGVIL